MMASYIKGTAECIFAHVATPRMWVWYKYTYHFFCCTKYQGILMAISVWRRLDFFPCDCQFNIAFLCKEITDHVCQDEDRHSWMIIAQETLGKKVRK